MEDALTIGEEDLPQVQDLARRLGVDTEFWDFSGQHRIVSLQTLVKVLSAIGVELTDRDSITVAHQQLDDKPWRRALPKGLVIRQNQGAEIPVHLPHGQSLHVWVTFEDDTVLDLPQLDRYVEPRLIDGVLTGRATFQLPPGLPLGWHRLHARFGDGTEHQTLFAITPERLELPSFAKADSRQERAWGVMAQLYSLSSLDSWGMGDFCDLETLAQTFAKEGADFVLINPIHAAEPAPPITPSPYLPTSRTFINPLYIRPTAIPEYDQLSALEKDQITVLFRRAAAPEEDVPENQCVIDRDKSWVNKIEALWAIYQVERSAQRQSEFEKFKTDSGPALSRFATWCCLQAEYGYHNFPVQMRDVNSPEVAEYARQHATEVDFYCYLQWIAFSQVEQSQASAKAAGMSIGIMNDLAVGVHSEGADAWCFPEAFATDVTVGAPPDMYNQRGQDWSQPPWRGDYLEETAYAPLREMARNAMRAGGALRIDHVMGLVRLWWIPKGCSPTEGTYVRYNHEAMVGVVMLEAARAGAILIGEDLGTVEPWVRDYYRERGVLGTSVLWFEKGQDGRLINPEHYRHLCLATVNTHDLPPTAGFIRGIHLQIQDQLGILPTSLEQAQEMLRYDLSQTVDRLNQMSLLDTYEPTDTQLIEALHRYIGQTPAALLGVSLVDTVGDVRMQNQPGTDKEYPNWRVPLADATGKPVRVEELAVHEGLARICAVMRSAVTKGN